MAETVHLYLKASGAAGLLGQHRLGDSSPRCTQFAALRRMGTVHAIQGLPITEAAVLTRPGQPSALWVNAACTYQVGLALNILIPPVRSLGFIEVASESTGRAVGPSVDITID